MCLLRLFGASKPGQALFSLLKAPFPWNTQQKLFRSVLPDAALQNCASVDPHTLHERADGLLNIPLSSALQQNWKLAVTNGDGGGRNKPADGWSLCNVAQLCDILHKHCLMQTKKPAWFLLCNQTTTEISKTWKRLCTVADDGFYENMNQTAIRGWNKAYLLLVLMLWLLLLLSHAVFPFCLYYFLTETWYFSEPLTNSCTVQRVQIFK